MKKNKSYSVEKIMYVYKMPKLLIRIMLFMQEFAVDGLRYNFDIPVILFSCCILSQGRS